MPASFDTEKTQNFTTKLAHLLPEPDPRAGYTRAELRKHLLVERKSSEQEQRSVWDEQIAERLLAWAKQVRPASLGLYWPIQAEPDLTAHYAALHALGIQLALPWVKAKEQPLTFLAWQPGDMMELDIYGIPLPAQKENIISPECILVPCVGFNEDLYRLGYGGGFYDRTLVQNPRPSTLAIAYDMAACRFAPNEFDIAMDGLLTQTMYLQRK